jgi:ribose/xylose/arabinose/galactoside ABC-type transport system permease subunit
MQRSAGSWPAAWRQVLVLLAIAVAIAIALGSSVVALGYAVRIGVNPWIVGVATALCALGLTLWRYARRPLPPNPNGSRSGGFLPLPPSAKEPIEDDPSSEATDDGDADHDN